MKSKFLAQIFFVLAFLGILYGGLAVFILKPKEEVSYYENRKLAQKPAFSLEALNDGSYFDGWTDHFSDYAPGRNILLRLDAKWNLDVFRRPVVNEVVPVGGKLLAFNPVEPVDREAIADACAQMAYQVALFNEQVKASGGTFLYVMVPGQTAYLADHYPWYLSNRQERTQLEREIFRAELEKQAVPYLDAGDIYEALGHPEEYYSEADYHYTFEGAFAVYPHILNRVNELSGWNVKVYQEDEINFRVLENPFLGSYLRKVYNQWDSAEHAMIGRPREPVPFRRYESGEEIEAVCFALPNNGWQELSYNLYMGGDCAETVIQTDRPELPSLLVFGDSFTNPMETLLYPSFDEMHSLDLRHYAEKSLSSYAAEYQPEVVVCIRDYEALTEFYGNGTLF
ncbi:MAG: hypothetical protein HFF18_07755 [Oscillospiraceae bacterium]|nr:hypothetical protein [Oscillospiraceae bacterium]